MRTVRNENCHFVRFVSRGGKLLWGVLVYTIILVSRSVV
jgi:hypothetical protein